MDIELVIASLICFLMMLLLVPVFRKAALQIGLVDKPNWRSSHDSPIPRMGGFCIGLIMALFFIILGFVLKNTAFPFPKLNYIGITSLVLLLVGVLDDRYTISAKVKLFVQALLAYVVFENGVYIDAPLSLLGIDWEPAKWFLGVLSIVVIVGGTNGFNLMDGIDGLASGMSVVIFTVYACLAIITGQFYIAVLCFAFVGALLGFLHFNLSEDKAKKKIFMGDAGSLFLGSIIMCFGILLIKNAPSKIEMETVFISVYALLTVPVWDSIRVYWGRARRGKSPFEPDKTHLHHLFLMAGFSHKKSSAMIVSLVVLLFLIAFSLREVFPPLILVSLITVFFLIIANLLAYNKKINSLREKIKELEMK